MSYGRILGVPRDLHPQVRNAESMVENRHRIAAQERSTPEPMHWIGATGEPAFVNGWVHFDTGTGTPDTSNPVHRNAGFYKDRGRVYLQGVVKNGTANAAFTLPVGYRPLNERAFIVLTNGVAGYAIVGSSGLVSLVGSNVYFFLDQINFRVGI